ncbi:ras-related protein ORAB-1-like [Hydra vulgaris]|uniref:ras-related protein ORAB-1-like n=1 Tax=Hydra vulgaris TaxID=6087 RepID=UPI0032E9FFD1
MDSYDYAFKIVVVGDSGVGKSSLLNCFCSRPFDENLGPTIGVDFKCISTIIARSNIELLIYVSARFNSCLKKLFWEQVCDINIESGASKKHIKLELWDTAGEERFRGITSVFYRNAHAALIVFDLARKTTFDSVKSWIENLKRYCGEDINLLLVANKCDLKQTVTSSDIEIVNLFIFAFLIFYIFLSYIYIDDFVYWNNIQYTETSAKNHINIQETIRKLSEDLVLKHQQLLSLSSFDSGPGSIFLQHTRQQTQGYCCGYLEF